MVTAMAALALILYTPWQISTLVIIPDVLVGLVIGYALSWWVPGIRRLVTTAPRRAAQVRAAAKQAFFDQAVSATRGRTGILVYYSDLERSLSILADLPVQGKVPGHRFNEILDRFQRCGGDLPLVARLSRVIAEVKDAVKAEFPPSASNPNELPDRPRIEQV
ncbi:MAG: hypothetical protein HY815_28420 [Candidatus Riflebacteria bacterium]|nr:hypothetical protein [Candidatus Riflebacteria bacterium]